MYSSVISVDWCPSLRPPVMCLTLSRDRTGATSPKLAEMKPMVRVTRDPIQSSNSKGQKSRSPGRLTPRTKISHIYGMGMPTNFKLGTRMEYNDPHHRRVRWPPRWNLLVVVQSHRACMGRGILCDGPATQAAQLVSKLLKLSSNFLFSLAAPSFRFLGPCGIRKFQGKPPQQDRQIHASRMFETFWHTARCLGNGAR